MKHIFILLLCSFPISLHSQNPSFTGKWKGSSIGGKIEIWEFIDDNTLIIEREGKMVVEEYNYDLSPKGIFVYNDTSNYIDAQFSSITSNYFCLKTFYGKSMCFSKATKEAFTINKDFLDRKNLIFKTTKNPSPKYLTFEFGHESTEGYWFDENCIKEIDLKLYTYPKVATFLYFDAFDNYFDAFGNYFVLKTMDSTIVAINLDDNLDTLHLTVSYFPSFIHSYFNFPVLIKEVDSTDVIGTKEEYSISVGKLKLQLNTSHSSYNFANSGNQNFLLNWDNLNDRIIAIRIYNIQIKEMNNNDFNRVLEIDDSFYLKFSKLADGRIIAKELNCGEEKPRYFLVQENK